MPSKDRLKNLIGALCPQGKPSLDQIREYVGSGVTPWSNLTDDQRNMYDSLLKSFTGIAFVRSNGFEFWFIKDFEKGQTISKWYRGYACTARAAIILARMKLIGIQVSFTNKIPKTFPWIDFAERSLSLGKWMFSSWSFQENKTKNSIEITAISKVYQIVQRSPEVWNLKTFVGKSIRPLTDKKTEDKIEMKKEAKHFALADFFKRIYGYTDIQKEISIDDYFRPLN